MPTYDAVTPEAIVRALAAKNPVAYNRVAYADACTVCLAERGVVTGLHHHSDCPWRLAVEWVAANPVERPVLDSTGCTCSGRHVHVHVHDIHCAIVRGS